MISSLSSSSYDLMKIGNANTYAKNLVNSYMNGSNGTTGSATGSSAISNFLSGTASGTIGNTATSNALFSTQNKTNLSLLKNASSALSSAAKSLTTGASSLLSSNSSVVATKGTLYSSSSMKFDVSVKNLATSQQSSSQAFSASAQSSFGVGAGSMTLATEKGSFDIGFTVKEGETNEDTLNSIAKGINNSKAGVTASVETKDGKSTLKLVSDETGEESAFELQGAAAEQLGMETSQEAANANYSVDGTSYTSATNEVSVPGGRGITMTLQGEGSASLTRGTDATKVVDAAKNFASMYNKAVSHLMSGSSSGAGASNALNLVADNGMTAMSMNNYGGYAASRLSSMGISIDDEGMMQIDEEKLTNAIQESPASVKDALSGYRSLADQTYDNAEKAMRIPSATYTDFSNMGVQSSLISTLMPSTGSLFDILL